MSSGFRILGLGVQGFRVKEFRSLGFLEFSGFSRVQEFRSLGL